MTNLNVAIEDKIIILSSISFPCDHGFPLCGLPLLWISTYAPEQLSLSRIFVAYSFV